MVRSQPIVRPPAAPSTSPGRWLRSGLVLAALASAMHADAAPAAPLRKWLDGPVRYIALTPEVAAFKKLNDDDARAAFIEGFWSRRDPEPGTLVNEFRQLFWERVREANERFVDGAIPGWKTDRGKVFILYGPPSRIEEDPFFETDALASGGRGVQRWMYEGSEHARPDINPTLVIVPFVRDATGMYRLTSDPELASEFYDLDTLKLRSEFEDWYQMELVRPSRTELAVMLDMGLMQTVPRQEEIILEKVEAYEAFGQRPLPVAVHRYRDPDSRASVVSVTLRPPPISEGAPRPAIIARFLPQGAPDEHAVVMAEGSFVFEGTHDDLRAQGRLVLDPGSYELTVLAVVPETSSTSMHRTSFLVPEDRERDGGLALSDVTLARELAPVRYQALRSYREPFVVGSFRVVPRVDNVVPRGEELSLFFEVYGGAGPYRTTYRLEHRRGDGPWRPVARPVVQDGGEGAQGWSVPTSEDWPAGDYRVVIDVEDAAGASRSADLSFRIDAVAG